MTIDRILRMPKSASRSLTSDGVRQVLMGYRGGRYAAIAPEWSPTPGMYYSVVRAISARINQNFDAWPSEELKKSYRSFLGKPVFVNHQNEDPKLARGKVIAARYIESGDDRYIEVIQEIDAQRFPKLAKELREGGLDSVSMGVEAGLTICSFCGNKANDEPDFCSHVRYHKGETLKRRNSKTGSMDDVLVYENCYRLGFFELSYVFDPADETAVVSRVIAANNNHRHHAGGCPPGDPSCSDAVGGIDAQSGKSQAAPQQKAIGGDIKKFLGDDYFAPDYSLPENFGANSAFGPGGGKSVPSGGSTPGASPDGGSPASSYSPSEGVEQWRDEVETALQRNNLPTSYADQVLHQVQTESSGNPNAQNNWDSNAQKGTPSGGLLQTIGPTYDSYKLPGAGNDLFNPQDNLDAAINYAKDTYGPTLMNDSGNGLGSGHGYDEGGWLPPGHTHVVNDTGEPELVIPMKNLRGPMDKAAGRYPRWLLNKIAGPSDDYLEWSRQVEEGEVIPEHDLPQRALKDRSLHDWTERSRKRDKLAYGEIEAPEDIDTLRDQDGEDYEDYQFVEPLNDDKEIDEDQPFQHYLESPDELRTPDLTKTKRLDREQETEGLDNDRRVEDVEDIMPNDQAIPAEPRGRQAMARNRNRRFYAETDDELIDEVEDELEQARGAGSDDDEDSGPSDSDDVDNDDIPDSSEEEDVDENDVPDHAEDDSDDEDDDAPPWAEKESRRSRPVGQTPSNRKGRRATKGTSTMGASMSQRGKVASRGARRHFADESGHVDGGPYGDDTSQGEQEDVYISQVPSAEGVDTADGGPISNTENNLVARRLQHQIRAKAADLQKDLTTYRRIAENVEAPDQVDPALSGTDEQDVKGSDFESLDLDDVETQPKDASVHAFARFDDWLKSTTGKTARQHGNANYIRRQAASYAKAAGMPLERMFPALEFVLRQARKAEGTKGANVKRRAEFDGEVVAPGARIDVEAPVSNVTDADAQASQYDLGDYGDNAGDNVADPELSTDSQIWAPGEAKNSNRKADAVAAVRYAEAWVNAGLPCDDKEKWKLIAQAQTLRHAAVVDRTRLLEMVVEANAKRAQTRKVAAAVSRGTANGIPQGLTAPRGQQRIAANDPANDVGIWL